MTLEAGDIILTSTPEGVVLSDALAIWLKEDNEVTTEVEKLVA